MEDSVHGKSRRYRPWSGGVDRASGCGIGIVNGGGEGWTLSRATHTLAEGLCVALHLPEILSGGSLVRLCGAERLFPGFV